MHFLILCILSSTSIFVIFKALDRYRIPPFPIILLNYFFATIIGFLLNPVEFSFSTLLGFDWLPVSVLIGILFILMFFLVARSSKEAGLSVTTVAGKMSVVFPIIMSLLISASDTLTPVKLTGILLTLAGVGLTVLKPGESRLNYQKIYLPLLLFVGMGFVDALVKYAQHSFVRDEFTALFSAVLFFFAFATGFITLAFNPSHLKRFRELRIWAWGLLLGLVNFGSIYFIVRALNFTSPEGMQTDSSIIFGLNNIGVVSLSVLTGLLVFREKLRPINWVGIIISCTAIVLFSMS